MTNALRVLQVVLHCADWVFSTSVIIGIVWKWLGRSREPALTIQREMRPFYPIAVVGQPVLIAVLDHVPPNFLACLNIATGMFLYWITGKDDDDRWNKRRKKLSRRVAEVGGRLQVVPAVNR